MPFVIFGGLLINLSQIPAYFVWYSIFSFVQYGEGRQKNTDARLLSIVFVCVLHIVGGVFYTRYSEYCADSPNVVSKSQCRPLRKKSVLRAQWSERVLRG